MPWVKGQALTRDGFSRLEGNVLYITLRMLMFCRSSIADLLTDLISSIVQSNFLKRSYFQNK